MRKNPEVEKDALETKKKPKDVDEYIAAQPKNIQKILQQLRQSIREAAPEAKETISYQMPAFEQNGILVWFAAFKNHIGFFPKVSAIQEFKKELSDYELSKGTVRFPLDKLIPYDLIQKIVKYRVEENSTKKAKIAYSTRAKRPKIAKK